MAEGRESVGDSNQQLDEWMMVLTMDIVDMGSRQSLIYILNVIQLFELTDPLSHCKRSRKNDMQIWRLQTGKTCPAWGLRWPRNCTLIFL
jgi:hypothetical protein